MFFLLKCFPFSFLFSISVLPLPFFSPFSPPCLPALDPSRRCCVPHWCWQSYIFPDVFCFLIFNPLGSHRSCHTISFAVQRNDDSAGGHMAKGSWVQSPSSPILSSQWWSRVLFQSIIRALSAQSSLFLMWFLFLRCPLKPHLEWDLLGIQFVNKEESSPLSDMVT